jgi:hypothetical protein
MAFQYGVTLRNNQVSQIQTTIGASGTLKIFSGAEPANCAAADPAGLLATIVLPASFLTSSGGVTTIAGAWSVAATGTGTPQPSCTHDGRAVCPIEGTASATLIPHNTSITTGQTVPDILVTAGVPDGRPDHIRPRY